jgi:hypothetical protein
MGLMNAAIAMKSISKNNPLGMIGQQLPTFIDEFTDKIVLNSQVETILYLDDSGSMASKLVTGQDILLSIEPMLRNNTRIVKFGRDKTVLSPRESNWSTALTLFGWDASSGSTYMWKMIEDDVKSRYLPDKNGNNQKLRLVVITDGHDTDSPGKYHGMNGMNPMMKSLLSAGYDIEFHIIILGNVGSGWFSDLTEKDVKKYESLAKATGGGCLVVSDRFNEKSPATKSFLSILEESSKNDTKEKKNRYNRRKKYEIDSKQGNAEKFDWLQLPPSDK